MDKCVSPEPFIRTDQVGGGKVRWEEPVFSDNSLVAPRVEASHTSPVPADKLGLGTTEVTYRAWDEAGNNATCVITVVVKGEQPLLSG